MHRDYGSMILPVDIDLENIFDDVMIHSKKK